MGESAPVDAYCRHEDTGHWECLSDVPPQGSLAAGRACPPLTNSHVVRLGCSVVCVCVHACVSGCWVLFRQPVVWCTDFLCPPPPRLLLCVPFICSSCTDVRVAKGRMPVPPCPWPACAAA